MFRSRSLEVDGLRCLCTGNSLVHMHAKCGSLEDVWRVFNKMPSCDVVSWNAILGGCPIHGPAEEALHLNGFVKKVYSQMISPCLCSVGL